MCLATIVLGRDLRAKSIRVFMCDMVSRSENAHGPDSDYVECARERPL